MRAILKKILPLNVKIWIYELVEWIYLPLLFIFNRRSDNNDTVVLVRCYNALGDFVVWLGTAKELRKMYPEKILILVCAAPMEKLAKQLDCFDKVVPVKVDLFNPASIYRTSKKLKHLQAQMLIQFVPKRTFCDDFIASSISACSKVTVSNLNRYHPAYHLRKMLDKTYDVVIPVNNHFMHQIQIDSLVLRYLGHNFLSKIYILPVMPIDKKKIPNIKFFIVSPGASHARKCWDIDKFAQVVRYIIERYKIQCCLCGAPGEQDMANRIIQLCGNDNIINMIGSTDVLHLIETVRAAEFVICNDTGIVHVAVAVSTPSVCISGPWEAGSFLPYDADDLSNCKQPLLCRKNMCCSLCDGKYTKECMECIRAHGQRLCIYNITVEDVKGKVDQLIIENHIEVNIKNEECS